MDKYSSRSSGKITRIVVVVRRSTIRIAILIAVVGVIILLLLLPVLLFLLLLLLIVIDIDVGFIAKLLDTLLFAIGGLNRRRGSSSKASIRCFWLLLLLFGRTTTAVTWSYYCWSRIIRIIGIVVVWKSIRSGSG